MSPDAGNIAERRSRLSPEKQALLEKLLREDRVPASAGIQRRSQENFIPLSFAQSRLWFINRLEPGSANYNIPDVYRLSGRLDVSALERAIAEMVRRHEVLRTTFVVKDEEPVQFIAPPSPTPLPVLDLSSEEKNGREAHAKRLLGEEAARPFDLEKGPLFRAMLLRLEEDDHFLLLAVHHIVFDGWSTGVYFDELTRLYEAYRQGNPSPLPEPALQYADFALWQRDWMKGEVLERQLAYWKNVLAGTSGILELQTDFPRPPVQTYRGAFEPVSYPKDLLESLQELGRRENATLFMTLAAAFQTLLHRYTGQDDIIIGTPIAGRSRVETERIIGFFVNTVLLRTDCSDNPTFLDVLRKVRTGALGAFEHQDVPFEKLVEELHPERDPARSPLCQAVLILQNAPMGSLSLPGLRLSMVETENETAKFDLSLALAESPEGLRGAFNFNTDLFEPSTIRRMAANFEVLLRGIVNGPERHLADLPLITDDERRRLVDEWNTPQSAPPQEVSVHGLFEKSSERTPDAIAVVAGSRTLTYAQLNRRANRLANELRRSGVNAGTLVGVCLRRSEEMIVALLGVLKAGGAYVPLDPAYPEQRLQMMAADARLRVIVTEEAVFRQLGATDATLVILEQGQVQGTTVEEANLPPLSRASDTAYVIFTSGSTGTPKGVMVSHGAVVGHCLECQKSYGLVESDAVLQFVSLSFDVSVEQIFATLAAGARLVIRGDEVWTAGELQEALVRYGITVISLPISYWRQIVGGMNDARGAAGNLKVRMAMVGGEAMLTEDVRMWLSSPMGKVPLYNVYGPTEATVAALMHRCGSTDHASEGVGVPLGRPMRNRSIYVIDRYGNLAPIGAAGELCIGGPTLALGYLNRPDLTAEKFVSDRFSGMGGGRLYRTGDIVRYRNDGTVEFLGRLDEQVKIRGYRIELGEIESVLARQRGVRHVAVISREDTPGDRRLVAYYVPSPGSEITVPALREALQRELPEYMVPSAFVRLESLPLNPNGKLERKALPAPVTQPGPAESTGPHTALELQLVKIWEKVLNRRPVGITDNFFDLGGHSVLAVKLFTEIEKLTGKNLPLATLFRAPTIERLAAILSGQSGGSSWSSLVPIKTGGSRPPLFCVHAIGGNVMTYKDLAQRLGPDQPVYGLQARGMGGSDSPISSVEEMASLYIKEIQTVQAEGPYFIGGACAGGILAFEMAQQLRRQGQEIGLLALFDTFAHTSIRQLSKQELHRFKLERLSERAHYHVRHLFLEPGRINYVRKSLHTLKRRLATKTWGFVNNVYARFKHPLPRALQRVAEYNIMAVSHYEIQPYPDRVVLFAPKTRSIGEYRDPEQGWGMFARGGVEIHEVDGDHISMFREPHVARVAQELSECLDRASVLRETQ